MKDKIRYEYKIDVDELEEQINYYHFQFNNQDFYLTKIRRNMNEFQDLIKLYQELLTKNYPVHQIIPTVNNSLTILVNDEAYILLLVTNPNQEYNLNDMLKMGDMLVVNSSHNSLERTSWAQLWSDKIDYFEYQISELGKDKKVVINTFGYFVGLCENAISYVNDTNLTIKPVNSKMVLSHKRVFYPNTHLNYDNPLNMIFDLEVRDVAEYLKKEALYDLDYALIDLQTYLKIRKLDLYSLSMLYARLIYPSYYFDLYEKVMNFNVDEDCLIKIMEKTPQIEEFLKKSFEIIVNYGPIKPVEWLLKDNL